MRKLVTGLSYNKILPVVSLGFLIFVGIGMAQVALPLLSLSLNISYTMTGVLVTIWGLSRLLFDIPSGILINKFGKRIIIVIGICVLCVGSVIGGLAFSFFEIALGRFLVGIGSGIFLIAIQIFLVEAATPENRAKTLSFWSSGIHLGTAIGPAIGSVAVNLFGLRAPFFLQGAVSVVPAIFCFKIIRDKPIDEKSSEQIKHKGRSFSVSDVKALLMNKNFMVVSYVSFSTFFTRMGIGSTIILLYGKGILNLDNMQLGFVLTLIAIGQLVMLFPAGYIADKFGRKKAFVPGLFVSGLFLLLLSTSQDYFIFCLASTLMGFGLGLVTPIEGAYIADIASEKLEVAVSLNRSIADLGYILGPVLLTIIADKYDLSVPFIVNGFLMILGSMIVQLFAKEVWVPKRA